MIMCLRKNNIRPIFVIDGKAPEQKSRTQKERRANRSKIEGKHKKLKELLEKIEELESLETCVDEITEFLEQDISELSEKVIKIKLYEKYKKLSGQCVKIEKKDLEKITNLLDCLGLPYIQAPDYWEAEKICSYLVNKNIVSAVLTRDSDAIAYGAKIVLDELNTKTEECVMINYSDILEELEFTKEQFKDFCICCGTDYNKNMPGYGPAKLYTLIKKNSNIETLESSGYPTDILYYKEVRELFSFGKLKMEIPPLKPVDYKQLINLFLKHNSNYNDKMIKKMLPKPQFIVNETDI
jgi:5'-3' exonuclease